MGDGGIWCLHELDVSSFVMGILTHSHWYGDRLHTQRQQYLQAMQQLAKTHVQQHGVEPTIIHRQSRLDMLQLKHHIYSHEAAS